MDLKESKKEIKRKLLDLVEKGSRLRDHVHGEYRHKRGAGTFNPKSDIANWNEQYRAWFQESITTLETLFEPATMILNRFKNPKIDATYPDGENMRWASLMKHINARLELLDNLYQQTDAIKEEELSDYIELSVPIGVGKIKVDKILSKFLK